MSEALVFPIMIFGDGACSGNPGAGGWGSIIVKPEGQVIELGGGERHTTNNKMELTAVIKALAYLKNDPGAVAIYTDSVYVIKGITQWIHGWRRRGWLNSEGADVANRDLWEKLFVLVQQRQSHPISWHYVRGHSGVPGNERVDEIAVGFVKGPRPNLYQGPLLGYHVPIHDLPEDTSVPERKSSSPAEKKAAFSYLSVVGGVLVRHSNWGECERRVKGQSGAKFKKALSESDEKAIIENWGFKMTDLS